MSNNKERLLDRSSYHTRTITTYNIISAYIVDIYYNHLYAEAIKFKNSGKTPSITEGYKHAVFAFLSAIKPVSKSYKPKHYTQILTGINEYFITFTSFQTLTISDCINKIMKEFIPNDYYDSFTKDQKRNMLRTILTNCIEQFTKVVIQEYLINIIDNHEEIANIEALKEKMTDLLILERQTLYHKFLDSHLSKNNEMVDRSIAVKMQQEIKTLVKEKSILTKENADNKKLIELRKNQLSELLDKYKELFRRYKEVKEELIIIKQSTNRLPVLDYVDNISMSSDTPNDEMESFIQQHVVGGSKPVSQNVKFAQEQPIKQTNKLVNQQNQSNRRDSNQSNQQSSGQASQVSQSAKQSSGQASQASQTIKQSSSQASQTGQTIKQSSGQTSQPANQSDQPYSDLDKTNQLKVSKNTSKQSTSVQPIEQHPSKSEVQLEPIVESTDDILIEDDEEEEVIQVESKIKKAASLSKKIDMGNEPSIGDIY